VHTIKLHKAAKQVASCQ